MKAIMSGHLLFNTSVADKIQFTGDGAGRDHDGYYWIRGRVDDVVNVSGHRLSTAEIEAALLEHRGHSMTESNRLRY